MSFGLNSLAFMLISLGAFFMLLAILKTRKLLHLLKKIKEKVFLWTVLFLLMVSFFAGYIASLFLISAGLKELLILLTGLVFFFGAMFVYIVVRVSSVTIYALSKKNKTEELNKELEKNIGLLKIANKELEEFAYVASHDLQEPLRTISNFVGLLDKTHSGKTDDDTRLYFNFILAATSKMQNLIKDLLDYSRVGKSITFSIVDCNIIFKEVIAGIDASIKESNAQITCANLPEVKGNYTQLKQLFQNLISNGIKFRKKNSIPKVEITVDEKATEYLFAVKDNGIGIEERYLNKLFVLFQRLHAETEYPGTGIGLAISKKIVTLHGGRIWVESKLGEGSIFYFTLPKEKIN
ncbi:MAG: ATP-binding protein [Bacteroidota bacterium]